MYTLVKSCRACQSTDLTPVFSLGLHPPANDFCLPSEGRQGFAPLEIVFCAKCSLSQLSVVVDKESLYRRYLYTTSNSETMRRHFDRLFSDIASELNGDVRKMVEIGSNTGSLLKVAQSKGYFTVGIDPAENLALIAEQNGVQTLAQFFCPNSAEQAVKKLDGKPSVILARHCFAHVDDWREFIDGLEAMSNPDTLICIEVPYVHNMLRSTEFDTAYFEHLSYVSLTAVAHLLSTTPFRIHRIQHYGIHGGSLLIMLRHKDSGIQPHLSADEYLSEDAVTVQHWERFAVNARQKINRMREAVLSSIENKKRVCGFGASAKMTVWLNAAGLTHKEILFVTDNSPLKPGRLIPGTSIPIISEELLLSEHPDVAFVGAWNYRSEILEKNKEWRKRGGTFIFPTPDGVEIV